MCFVCTLGETKQVDQIRQKALSDLQKVMSPDEADTELNYGIGHIVFEDYNYGSAAWCIEGYLSGELHRSKTSFYNDLPQGHNAFINGVVISALWQIEKLPDDEKWPNEQ